MKRNKQYEHITCSLGFVLIGFASLSGCVGGIDEQSSEAQKASPTFEEFRDTVPFVSEREEYIVEGDIALNEEQLRDYYERNVPKNKEAADNDITSVSLPLAVVNKNGANVIWNSTRKLDLRYCVSTEFDNYTYNLIAVANAMNSAVLAWQEFANIKFVYQNSENSNCSETNNNVTFNVAPGQVEGNVAASAAFPSRDGSSRTGQLTIDVDHLSNESNPYMVRSLTHEIGHILGFTHESSRQSTNAFSVTGNQGDWQNTKWNPLTVYDVNSIMGYSGIAGMGAATVLSDGDKNGVACAYGARSGFTPVCGWYGAAYSGHVQNIGWTPRVLDGDTVGTMGQGLRLEAMKIWVGTNNQNSICYRTHVQNVGWQDIHCNGDLAGTEGQSLAIEAIKIWLPYAPTGCMVQSRAHVQDIGWQVWKTNGASEPSDSSNNYSGTTGQSKRIEALQIKVIGCN